MQLYLLAVSARPYRPVTSNEFLQTWRWRPPISACPLKRNAASLFATSAAAASAWVAAEPVRPELCASKATLSPSQDVRSPELTRLVKIVAGNASGHWRRGSDLTWMATAGGGVTTSGLWLAGQAMRHARAAIGPCTSLMVEKLLRAPLDRLRLIDSQTLTRGGGSPYRIGVQIRRGDACERWTAVVGDGDTRTRRPCFTASAYYEGVRAMVHALQQRRRFRGPGGRREGAAHTSAMRHVLLVATDSPQAVRELEATVPAAEFEILHVGGPRGAHWGGVGEA